MSLVLQYYEPCEEHLYNFGYQGIDDKGRKLIDQRKPNEHRETFFKRIGTKPGYNMYGSDPVKDSKVNSNKLVARMNSALLRYGLDKLVEDENDEVREAVAEQGFGLDRLIKDKSTFVREAVAEQGYGFEILLYDKSSAVRKVLARRGYALEKLIDDPEYSVRVAVAENGYHLEKLIHDESPWVRDAVVRQGYGLDILVNDKDSDTRIEVANKGYGLDKLIKDKEVRKACETYLKEHNYNNIREWIRANPDKLADEESIKNRDSLELNSTINKFFSYFESDQFISMTNTITTRSGYLNSNGYIELRVRELAYPFIYVERERENEDCFSMSSRISNEGDEFKLDRIVASREGFSIFIERVCSELWKHESMREYVLIINDVYKIVFGEGLLDKLNKYHMYDFL